DVCSQLRRKERAHGRKREFGPYERPCLEDCALAWAEPIEAGCEQAFEGRRNRRCAPSFGGGGGEVLEEQGGSAGGVDDPPALAFGEEDRAGQGADESLTLAGRERRKRQS